ncbi:pseudouridine-5'-phosphate glycosidase-like [Curcuma longa]|uniref:pseudouridine-5'-phosphate glycosidase-like n=1 Tax=Curcuma longa TaxID=136217 RepID=UPI003D9F49CE
MDRRTEDQNDSILVSLKIAPDVNDALLHGNPVVALESTIISHGMPYPQNLQTAKEVQAILKANGVVPATIAILDGVPCIGMSALSTSWIV